MFAGNKEGRNKRTSGEKLGSKGEVVVREEEGTGKGKQVGYYLG